MLKNEWRISSYCCHCQIDNRLKFNELGGVDVLLQVLSVSLCPPSFDYILLSFNNSQHTDHFAIAHSQAFAAR